MKRTTSARPRESQPHRPLCREALSAEPYTCPGCDTRYHTECAGELGGCSVLGCERRGSEPLPTQSEDGLSIFSLQARINSWFSLRGPVPIYRRPMAWFAMGWVGGALWHVVVFATALVFDRVGVRHETFWSFLYYMHFVLVIFQAMIFCCLAVGIWRGVTGWLARMFGTARAEAEPRIAGK